MPPGFCRAPYENDGDNDDEGGDAFLGPALPPGYKADPSSSEDEDVIGPMPSRGPNEDTLALDFERRAQRMKEKLTGEVSVNHSLFFLNKPVAVHFPDPQLIKACFKSKNKMFILGCFFFLNLFKSVPPL